MSVGLSTTVKNLATLQIADIINTAAGTTATLKLYSGTKPVPGGTAGTALVTCNCSNPVLLTPSGSSTVITWGTVAAGTASSGGVAPGTNATWARLATGGGVWVADFTVTATGGGGDLTMNNVAVISSPAATITPGTLTLTVLG